MAVDVAHERGCDIPMRDGQAGIDWNGLIAPTIVLAAVLFNPMLAFVNGNVRPLSSAPVIACEIAIVLAAHVYAVANFDRRMRVWYAYLGVIAAFAVVRMTATGVFEVKYLRDLLMIPTFVVLGLVAKERQVLRCMLILQACVVGGIVLEGAAVDHYSALFQVKEYYINTRGISSEEFTNEASSLFVSATRPEARFFPFFELHRLSSVFLEPVSLGNFAIITVVFTMAFWSRLKVGQRAFLAASIILMLFACDGRFSAIAGTAVLAVGLFSRVLPRNVALLFLPIVTGATIAVSIIGDFKIGTDDLPGRLAHTQHWLGQMWFVDYLGASNRLLPEGEDSGIIYLIISQSLPGLVALWLVIVLGLEERTRVHQNYKNGICVYISLLMMISFAMVSIKTAAPMWFVYGFLIAWGGGRDACSVAAAKSHP